MSRPDQWRRRLLQTAGLLGAALAGRQAHAYHTETHFEETVAHKLVYQLNHADPDYIDHILFSCGEMLRKYGDDIELVIAMFGPGIHLVGKKPGRPISEQQQQKASSLASYGVAFHTCGNTMKSVGWDKKDLLDFAEVVPIGVDDLMLLQERGFSYVSW